MVKKSKCLKFLENKSENTQKAYAQSIKQYEEFHGESMERLVIEALDEQAERVPHHLLKIIDRIELFQEHLLNRGLMKRTIDLNVGRIKTVYVKNRVEIPYIEEINPKKVIRREVIEYDDILTKYELKKAIPLMRPPSQARAMVMISGGLSNEECEHLTLKSFLEETHQYHQCDDDIDALKWLSDETHPIIWVTKLIRIKTGKPYYALIGAEAVNSIAKAKLYEHRQTGEIPEKLLSMHKISFNRVCDEINKKLNLGYAGQIHHCECTDDDGNIYIPVKLFKKFEWLSNIEYQVIKETDRVIISTHSPNTEVEYNIGGMNRLRPHMLRKFNATYIRGSVLTYEENVRISNSEIDEMQGRGKTSVQDTYIKTNPLEQKLLYAKVMNNVSLHHTYDYELIDGDVRVWIHDPTLENEKLKKEVKKLSSELEQKQKNSEKLNALKEELGEDTFKELVYGILNAS